MTTPEREQYRQRKGSRIWHFMENCQHWPVDPHGKWHAIGQKPKTGTLCDQCQSLEKKARKP